jgi:hypothetical protein
VRGNCIRQQSVGVVCNLLPIKANGAPVELVALDGKRGHLDGMVGMKRAEKEIAAVLAK